MDDSLIDRLIDEMSEFEQPFFFSPFKVNEPLLDKRLRAICQRMERETIATIRLFTNGAALTQANIDWIAELRNVGHLWVSLNSVDPDEYEALMSMPFERTAKRLDNLHNQEFPHPVMLSCVGYPNETFRRYCWERWPNFQSFAIQRSDWLGYTHSQIDDVPDMPCGRWFELSIMADGRVSLCCMDGTGKYAIGDLNEQTLLDVYNDPSWRGYREQWMSRKTARDPCSSCTYGG